MTASENFTRDYRSALLRYLPRREEAPLAKGYELGRTGLEAGVSVLDMAEVHHRVLLEVLGSAQSDELPRIATAASEFLLAVLSAGDMAQRAFLEEIRPEHVEPERTTPLAGG